MKTVVTILLLVVSEGFCLPFQTMKNESEENPNLEITTLSESVTTEEYGMSENKAGEEVVTEKLWPKQPALECPALESSIYQKFDWTCQDCAELHNEPSVNAICR